MSQRYVPNDVFLVCSDGMKKSQMLVKSQTTIKIANGKLAATINDRFQGNFFCSKMVIAGAIIGAIAAAIFVAATILTGGAVLAGTAAAIGAGAAAGGAAVGAGVALVPSICSMLTSGNQWAPVHPKVKFEDQKALIEHSKIPCVLGGNVMIFYSEKAADEFTDLKVASTVTHVGGIILGSALLSGGVATILGAGSAFLGNIKLVNATFGTKAALLFAGEGALWLGAGYQASVWSDDIKGWTYEQVQDHTPFPVADYAGGKTLEQADKVTGSTEPLINVDIPGAASTTDYYADASGIMHDEDAQGQEPGQRRPQLHEPNITNYEDLEYERRTGVHTQDGAIIEETELDRTHNRSRNAIPERNPTRTSTSSTQHQGDASGTYYNRETYNLEQGQQLERTTLAEARGKGVTSLKNALPSLLEWGIDAYNILSNKLLEMPIEDYNESLKEEAKAKRGVTVIETNI
jgi:hypothetical protein